MEKSIILKSGQCSWGKCTFCGWGRLENPVKNFEEFKDTIDRTDLRSCKRVKIFASGSFLDDKQFDKKQRQYLAQKLKETEVEEVVLESRPEFITKESLKDFEGITLFIAIGLEVGTNEELTRVAKGFAVEDYIKATEIIHETKNKVRTYLLANPPLIKNIEQSLDNSIQLALKYSDEIVVINTFPHSKAPIYNLWIEGKWKPLDKKEFEDITKKWREHKNIEFDFENFNFRPRIKEKANLKGAGEDFLTHRHYEVWQDYFQRFYESPERQDIALFIPCSFRKPYSKSRTHKAIMSKISGHRFFKRIHIVVISSPGVIPYEFKNEYPFNAYDWPEWLETEEIKKRYIEVITDRIYKYLKNHEYKKILVYLKPDSESFAAFKEACKKLKAEYINCFPEEKYEEIKKETEKNPIINEQALEYMKGKVFEAIK